MQTEDLFNTLADTLAEGKDETLSEKLGEGEAVALLDILHDTLA